MLDAYAYGPLLRLWGITPAQVPAAIASAMDLKPLLAALLSEAIPFIQDVPADPAVTGSPYWVPNGLKTYAESAAPVYLFQREVPASELRPVARANNVSDDRVDSESWFLRRSTHVDAADKGTASWDEFKAAFKDEHAKTEMAFTPTIISTELHRAWDVSDVEVEHAGDAWTNWTLKYEHSVHRLPFPLKKRDFPVLQATAAKRAKEGKQFITIQVAVRGVDKDVKEMPSDTIQGVYTSVERVTEDENGRIEWVMGTVSDAKGVLPTWVQKLALPDQVAKDVQLFMGWIPSQRKK